MSNKWIGEVDKPDLTEYIKYYFKTRGLTMPDFHNAMKFVITEIAEVYEVDLARSGNWVRNHPENKPTFSKTHLAEELGDAIFMLIIAGMAEGVDPLEAMRAKMTRKLGEAKMKSMSGVSSVVPVTDEEAERIFNEVEDNAD